MEEGRNNWTDDRLDDFRRNVDKRFDDFRQSVDKRFDETNLRMDAGFARVDAELREVNTRFDALQRTMIQVAAAFGAALLTMVATMVGLIITQI